MNTELQPADERRRRTEYALLIALIIGTPFALKYGLMKLWPVMAMLVIIVMTSAISLVYIRRTGRHEGAAYLTCGMFLVLVAASNVASGGFYDPNMGWLYVVPLAGAVLVNVRLSVILTVLILVTVCVFWSLPRFGVDLPNLIPVDERSTQALANRVSAVFAIGALSWIFVRTQRRVEQKLEVQSNRAHRLANFDELTGLLNRRGLREIVAKSIDAGRPAALLFIDLDRFKDVNDTLGHNAGDLLLREIAARIDACVGASDEENRLCRLGGDEFIVVLSEPESYESVVGVVERILEVLCEPVFVEAEAHYVAISIGVAFAPEHGDSMTQLMKAADAAMFDAKRLGGNQWCLYRPELTDVTTRRMDLERGLRRALEDEELEVVYQPIVETESGRIRGVEALVRWTRPSGEACSPAEFIPVAEVAGLAAAVDRHVMREAVSRLAEWRKAGHRLSLALNVSAAHWQDETLTDFVVGLIDDFGLPRSSVDLELTESAVLRRDEATIRNFERIREAGIGLSLDDFGTGYSSLSHLLGLPVTKLKLDRSFVEDIDRRGPGQSVCRSVIELATSLSLEIIAEGVERMTQRHALLTMGCPLVQGYGTGRPMSVPALEKFLSEQSVGTTTLSTADLGPDAPKLPTVH